MAEEGLKIRVGADVSDATNGLKKLGDTVKQTTESLGKVQKSSADATYALTNMNRIIQDAPYGFLGISNNLNPMLESFQRLQKETGSAGAALKSMVSGLMGPAGIGVAVAAVSSLLVVFGDKLFSSSKAADEVADSIKRIADEAENATRYTKELADALSFANRIGELNIKIGGGTDVSVINAQIENTKNALDRLAVIKRDLQDKANEASANLASVDIDNFDEAKKNVDEIYKRITENDQKAADLLGQIAILKQQKVLAQRKIDEDALKDEEAAAKKREAEYKRQLAAYERYVRMMEKLRQDLYRAFLFDPSQGRMKAGATDVPPQQQPVNQVNNYLNGLKQQFEAGLGPSISSQFTYLDTKELDDFAKHLKNLKETQREVATILKSTLTPAFEEMFQAIANGENAFEAFGKSLLRSIEQLIAQLLALAAVAEIISLIFPGAGSFASIFGNLSGIKIPKHAAGGITNGPQIGMIGEAGPEAIIPLDRLPSLIGQMGLGGNIALQPSIHYEGTGFRIMLNRVDKAIGRSF